jgi:hypothetical protein
MANGEIEMDQKMQAVSIVDFIFVFVFFFVFVWVFVFDVTEHDGWVCRRSPVWIHARHLIPISILERQDKGGLVVQWRAAPSKGPIDITSAPGRLAVLSGDVSLDAKM